MEHNPLGIGKDVRREVRPAGLARCFQGAGEREGRRSLAVRADHLNDPQGALGVVEELKKSLDALEA